MFISTAYAQSASGSGNDFLVQMLLIVLMLILIIYFLYVRPRQQRLQRLKTDREFLANVRRDEACTPRLGLDNAVFVSYRRADSIHVAGRLYDRLTSDLGKSSVFKDIDSIPLGADFRRHIDDSLKNCQVFLLVMGKNWQGASASKSRIDDPNDLIRIEVETALRRKIPVIPILIDSAPMPDVAQLPTSLQGIAYRQAINVRADPDFHRDVDRLVGFLRSHLRME